MASKLNTDQLSPMSSLNTWNNYQQIRVGIPIIEQGCQPNTRFRAAFSCHTLPESPVARLRKQSGLQLIQKLLVECMQIFVSGETDRVRHGAAATRVESAVRFPGLCSMIVDFEHHRSTRSRLQVIKPNIQHKLSLPT